MKKWLVAVLLGLFAAGAQAANRIDRLETASWWFGMKKGRADSIAIEKRPARREDVWALRLAPGGGLAIRFVATP